MTTSVVLLNRNTTVRALMSTDIVGPVLIHVFLSLCAGLLIMPRSLALEAKPLVALGALNFR